MLLTIAASFVYMMVRLYHAIEQEKREKQEKGDQHADKPKTGNE